MYITEVLCCTEVNNTTLQISYEVKWEPLNCVRLCNPVDYTVHWILQARILEWVAFPFSRGSSQPRDWSRVSCIAGRFFTSWATREAQTSYTSINIWKWIKKGKYLFTAFTSTPWDQGQTTKASLQRWEQERIWRESFPPSSRDSFPCLSDCTWHLGSTPTTPSFLLSATSWSCFLAKYLLYLGQISAILRWSTQEFSTIFMLFVFAFLLFFFFVCKKQENYHWISISVKGLQAIWLKTPAAFLKTEGGVRRGVWAPSAQVGPHPGVSLLPRDLSSFFLFNPTGARISPLPWSRCIAVTLFADSRASLPRKASTGWWGHFFPWPLLMPRTETGQMLHRHFFTKRHQGLAVYQHEKETGSIPGAHVQPGPALTEPHREASPHMPLQLI